MSTRHGPLVFLDIDGVLRRTGAPLYALEDEPRRTFEEALRGIPHAEIVISSSWREGFSLDEIRVHFSDDVALRIIGATPIVLEGEHRRYREILSYLIRNRQKGRQWMAIDDDPENYPRGINLVLVDPSQGFDSAAAVRLLEAGGAGLDRARIPGH
jgi:hypothetical protein